MSNQLPAVIADHIEAVNAFDVDRVIATFADDALVNDNLREFWGIESIGKWVAKEIVGDRVTMDVTEVIRHRGMTAVRARYDGDYDKTNLPNELILTNYFEVENGKITTLTIIHNSPAPF